MKPPLALRVLPAVAYRAWFTPPPLGRTAAQRDAEAAEGLEPVSLELPGGLRVSGYQAGEGPVALALHGWGGRSAQMSEIARRLAEEGLRVVTVDLPGGAGGEPTDIKQAAAAIEAAVRAIGPPQVVVAHSFAALALRLVRWDSVPSRVVMAAPVVKVADALDRFAARARLAPWVGAGLWRRLEAWDPDLFARVNQADPGQLAGAELLILHDPEDPDAAFAASAELAVLRPATRLVPVTGAGHNGVLRDPAALDRIADFVAQEVGPRPSAGV